MEEEAGPKGWLEVMVEVMVEEVMEVVEVSVSAS